MYDKNERINESKPNWMAAHEASDNKQFQEIKDALLRIEEKIDPVVDSYKAATTLGRWFKAAGAAIVMVLTIWYTYTKIKTGM